jgi:hypothetical protein
VTLFSNASQTLYPENTLEAFTVELAQSIEFDPNDKLEVGLYEFSCPQNFAGGSENAIIYCDLIPAQLVGSSLARCLRTFVNPTKLGQFAFKNIYYLPVEKRTISNIIIKIMRLSGDRVLFRDSTTPLKLVLHFIRV